MNNSNEESGALGAADKLLSNPAALSALLGLLKSKGKNLPDTPPSSSGEAISSLLSGEAGGSDILGGLLSNPEFLSKLPSVIETLKPMLDGKSAAGESESSDGEHRKNNDSKKRIALLSALKPYMNSERREAIDYIIKISQITEMFK